MLPGHPVLLDYSYSILTAHRKEIHRRVKERFCGLNYFFILSEKWTYHMHMCILLPSPILAPLTF